MPLIHVPADVAPCTAAFAAMVPLALDADANAVLVLQREAAVLLASCPRAFAGSCEATTCVIALVCARAADGAPAGVLVAHVDDASAAAHLARHVADFAAATGAGADSASALELSLVGAYGSSPASRGNVAATLAALSALPDVHVRLAVACVGDANTATGPRGVPWPRHAGAAIDVRTGAVTPASWASRGPDWVARAARLWSDEAARDALPLVYDAGRDAIVTPPLSGAWAIGAAYARHLLALADDDLLRESSTSPDAEAPGFCAAQRAVARFVLHNLTGRAHRAAPAAAHGE